MAEDGRVTLFGAVGRTAVDYHRGRKLVLTLPVPLRPMRPTRAPCATACGEGGALEASTDGRIYFSGLPCPWISLSGLILYMQ